MGTLLALDVGTKRIGVAVADSIVPIAVPMQTVEVDGTETEVIQKIVLDKLAEKIVIGYPRNQSGDPTEQTTLVETFAARLGNTVPIVFQDESVTSVIAEDRLKATNKPYQKGDIDALAAAIILQDYLEIHHAA